MSDGIFFATASELIKRHEGLRIRVYDDATGADIRSGKLVIGHPTIGWGRNLIDPGISEEEAEILLAADIRRAINLAQDFAGEAWHRLDHMRRAALVDMAFNLGGRITTFRRFRRALMSGDYEIAAREMLDSKWASQVGRRAVRLARIMRDGG